MAEKRFIKGLFKDTGHIDQPEGTWRHAHNMVLNLKDGSVSNEGGTVLDGFLGTNPSRGAQSDKVIGVIEVDDDRAILFVVNVVQSIATTGNPPRSEIGLWEKGVYYPIFNPSLGPAGNPTQWITNDLGFRESNPINGTFKIDSKGDLLVYWTDDLNPPRAFNVDRQLRESGNGTLAGVNVNMLYGLGPAQIQHIDMLNLFPYSGSIPHINIDDQGTHQNCVIEGGGLLTGVYYLALAYVDDDLVATNFLTVSNPVPIVDEYDYTLPTNKKDGAKEGSQTTKAIKWEISNLNKNYKYLRPVIIRSKGDAQEAFRLNDMVFTTSTTSIVYSGLETQSTGSPSEVIIDTVSYDTAKTIQQLDNILYIGNTTGTKDVGYQKYANNIKLRARVDRIPDFDMFIASVDNLESGWGFYPVNSYGGSIGNPGPVIDTPHTQSYRYVPNLFSRRGYMRDEIYAFYIAFVMNDGSMSYAYHIPGREALGFEKEPVDTLSANQFGGLWDDIHKVSPEFSKRFHWIDSTVDSISGPTSPNPYNALLYMGMNYWENATEFYPDTENYQVWDAHAAGNNGQISTLVNENVRHHHFPSNRNKRMKTILDDKKCRTAKTAGTQSNFVLHDTVLTVYDTTGNYLGNLSSSSWKKQRFTNLNGSGSVPNSNNTADALACWSTDTFTADSPMRIRVKFVQWWEQNTGWTTKSFRTRVRTSALDCNGNNVGNWTITDDTNSASPFSSGGSCGGAQTDATWDFPGTNFNLFGGGGNAPGACGGGWVELQPGDQVWLETKKNSSGGVAYDAATPSQINCYASQTQCVQFGDTIPCFSVFEIEMKSLALGVDTDDLHDAQINHDVQRLGFDLEDIKIPQSIADKVQGFRVYYAKRKHSDRTILGQQIIIPAMYRRALLGVCEEATSSGSLNQALHAMQTLQTTPEPFYDMHPYADTWTRYPIMPYYSENGTNDPVGPIVEDERGMNVFSFHDFYLQRTKNSLAAATHIDIQYYVHNLAWNGSATQQDKRMNTRLMNDPNSTSDTVKVKEIWGWDADQNCYPQDVATAVFMGCEYVTPSARTQPRLLGQKAKTYILGDTIFKGDALGFGGKLFNEFGESAITFRLMDNHAISAYKVRSMPYSNTIGYFFDTYGAGAPELENGHYGRPHDGWHILTTTLDAAGNFNGTGTHSHKYRSMSAMVNLKAYKTDVYKSIDNQELVWTGFEVLGAELQEYVFDKDGTMQGSGNTIDTHPEGIYGGDAHICRHGITPTLKPSNDVSSSVPMRAIHYHIVESTDNINFRYSDSDDSLYFPNSVSKLILRESGTKDFHHFDNIKYNDNYSELNSIRPAFPLPVRDVIQDDFATRVHRSAKHDTTSLIDNYRIFLANQFKDLPKNRGDLWKLSSFNNLLYFHMEESLFAAQGKQQMQMKDGSEAFIGSGDIFAQEPNELIQTDGGFGGTQSHYAAITTRYGYFFVDAASNKVFMMKDSILEISAIGMDEWFKDNLNFELDNYGLNAACVLDNPIIGFGYHAIYDPKFKRIILTKREFTPTQKFIDGWEASGTGVQPCPAYPEGKIRFNSQICRYEVWGPLKGGGCGWRTIEFTCSSSFFNCGGFTISYYPELGIWGSFHDYIPYIYFNTSTEFYSLTDKYPRPVWAAGTNVTSHLGTTFGNAGIWKHNSTEAHGIYYQEWKDVTGNITQEEWLTTVDYYDFAIEFIHNEYKTEDTLLSSFGYTLETINQENISVLENGFTSFFVYNTFQISGENNLEYLINTRRIGNNWKVNRFRDMAAAALNTNNYYMSTNINVTGGTNVGTVTTSNVQNMFIYNGMSKTVNAAYLDLTKNWNLQRKFIDKWVGIRLIYNNISNNSLNLYGTSTAVRKMHR
tara:strand:+ start:9436 stop:15012 length:5577 start_codon:yes stop_codon:yes gene_type:complete